MSLKDILNQAKDKGDKFTKDHVPHAVSKPHSGFDGVFGGTGGEVHDNGIQKSKHPHGSTPNKIRVKS